MSHIAGCPCRNETGWGTYATCVCYQLRQSAHTEALNAHAQVLREAENNKDERLTAATDLIDSAKLLANTSDTLSGAAWSVIRHEFGEHFTISDADTSPWARIMRKFLVASDAHIAADKSFRAALTKATQ